MPGFSSGKRGSTLSRRGVLVSHSTGNQNVRELLWALKEAGLLRTYLTSIGTTREQLTWTQRRTGMAKRQYPMIERTDLSVFPFREVIFQTARLSPVKRLRRRTDSGRQWSPLWVSESIDRRAAQLVDSSYGAAYGYLGQASHMFSAARRSGVATILEAHHATMRATLLAVGTERERSPEWSDTLPNYEGLEDTGVSELNDADLVVSPSNQVTQSVLAEWPTKNVLQIPYGCPTVPPTLGPVEWDGSGPLRVLFVGRLGAIKGLAALSHVAQSLGQSISLTVIGARPASSSNALDSFLSRVNYLGTQPRNRVLEIMRGHHVFVMPSVIEGRSLAVLEALSCGLPCIVTPGSGVDDLVARGAGIVIPTSSGHLLESALESVIRNPSLVRAMSTRSIDVARESSWSTYRASLVSAVATAY